MAAKTYVIDASVAIKWFADERDSQSAILLRKSHSQGSVALIAPDLILYEVSNGLRFNKIFSCEDIDAGIASMMSIRIRFYPPKEKLLREAIKLALQTQSTVYDAVYLVLAIQSGSVLITADEAFAKSTKGLPIITLAEFARSG